MPDCPLTVSHLNTLGLLDSGLTVRQAGDRLGLDYGGTRRRLANIYGLLAVHSLTQALHTCHKEGWMPEAQQARTSPQRFHRLLGCPLSPGELSALQEAASGLTSKQAAMKLGLAHRTYLRRLTLAYQRLGVSCIGQALAVCFAEGWVDSDLERVGRSEEGQEVTWAQRLYLEAFDQSLGAEKSVTPDLGEVLRTARLRADALVGVNHEAHRTTAARQPSADPIDQLLTNMATRL